MHDTPQVVRRFGFEELHGVRRPVFAVSLGIVHQVPRSLHPLMGCNTLAT